MLAVFVLGGNAQAELFLTAEVIDTPGLDGYQTYTLTVSADNGHITGLDFGAGQHAGVTGITGSLYQFGSGSGLSTVFADAPGFRLGDLAFTQPGQVTEPASTHDTHFLASSSDVVSIYPSESDSHLYAAYTFHAPPEQHVEFVQIVTNDPASVNIAGHLSIHQPGRSLLDSEKEYIDMALTDIPVGPAPDLPEPLEFIPPPPPPPRLPIPVTPLLPETTPTLPIDPIPNETPAGLEETPNTDPLPVHRIPLGIPEPRPETATTTFEETLQGSTPLTDLVRRIRELSIYDPAIALVSGSAIDRAYSTSLLYEGLMTTETLPIPIEIDVTDDLFEITTIPRLLVQAPHEDAALNVVRFEEYSLTSTLATTTDYVPEPAAVALITFVLPLIAGGRRGA